MIATDERLWNLSRQVAAIDKDCLAVNLEISSHLPSGLRSVGDADTNGIGGFEDNVQGQRRNICSVRSRPLGIATEIEGAMVSSVCLRHLRQTIAHSRRILTRIVAPRGSATQKIRKIKIINI